MDVVIDAGPWSPALGERETPFDWRKESAMFDWEIEFKNTKSPDNSGLDSARHAAVNGIVTKISLVDGAKTIASVEVRANRV